MPGCCYGGRSANGGWPGRRRVDCGTRREFMSLAAWLAAGATRLGGLGAAPAAPATAHRPLTGFRDYTMAMHVHASFSEGEGSMQAQMAEAVANGLRRHLVDRARLADERARLPDDRCSFDSLTDEAEAGRPWHWQPHTTGAPAAVGGGIVARTAVAA